MYFLSLEKEKINFIIIVGKEYNIVLSWRIDKLFGAFNLIHKYIHATPLCGSGSAMVARGK